jgi:hypothetical protein
MINARVIKKRKDEDQNKERKQGLMGRWGTTILPHYALTPSFPK